MAKWFGEVIATPGEQFPFKIEFTFLDQVYSMPVRSEADGEALIIETLQALKALAKKHEQD
jgi:hypothetical protein